MSVLFFDATFTLFWPCSFFLIWNMILCGNFSAKNNLVTLLISSQFTSVLTTGAAGTQCFPWLSKMKTFTKSAKKCLPNWSKAKPSKTRSTYGGVLNIFRRKRLFHTIWRKKGLLQLCAKDKKWKNEVSMSALECFKSKILLLQLSKIQTSLSFTNLSSYVCNCFYQKYGPFITHETNWNFKSCFLVWVVNLFTWSSVLSVSGMLQSLKICGDR